MQIIDPSSSLGCASQAGDLAALEERTEQLGELVVGDLGERRRSALNRVLELLRRRERLHPSEDRRALRRVPRDVHGSRLTDFEVSLHQNFGGCQSDDRGP